jgi:type I restriction enzyme S subunit
MLFKRIPVGITTRDVTFNQDVKAIVPNANILPRFLLYWLQAHESLLLNMVEPTGIGAGKLPTDRLFGLQVKLPPLPEQHRIAQLLSVWDESISLARRLVEAKRQRREALMQQLLAGAGRFKEFEAQPWLEASLGQFLTVKLRKVRKPSTSYRALGIRSHGKGTFVREVEDPDDVAMTHLYEVHGGDLIVNITFAWEGAIAMVQKQDEGCLVSHRFPTYVINRKRVDPDFFKYLMVTRHFIYNLGVISPGGAGRNRVLSKRDFLKMRVSLPPLGEQKRIAEVLCAADQEIDLLNQKLYALQRQKRGIMQHLLTTPVRASV